MNVLSAVIIVTFNRKFLLIDCLNAIANQTRLPNKIILIDNASTDGTQNLLYEQGYLDKDKIDYTRLDKNLGGAGGFHTGMKLAYDQGYEWIWVMDDDTIPTSSALEALLAVAESPRGLTQPVILASKVLWTDDSLHPMNRPRFFVDRVEQFLEAATKGLLLLRSSSFVSLMIHRDAIEKYGLPLKHYFIWNDDAEFTARILRFETGYLVPESVVHHKTADNYTVLADNTGRYYYHIRNTIFMIKSQSWDFQEKVKLLLVLCWYTTKYLKNNNFDLNSISIVTKGIFDGTFREKSIIKANG
jgi:rhamnopyranosyl-N-acetylglucosaminyl-diphospho-decaprenol beta-1,3/1,4-galactofuranosyltransferase